MWQYLSAVLTATSASTSSGSKANKPVFVDCIASVEFDEGNSTVKTQQQPAKTSTCIASNTRQSTNFLEHNSLHSAKGHSCASNTDDRHLQLVCEDTTHSMPQHEVCLQAGSRQWHSTPLDPHLLLVPAVLPAQILTASPIAAAANNCRSSMSHGRDVCSKTDAPSNDSTSFRTCSSAACTASPSEPATTCSPADVSCLLSSNSIDNSILQPSSNLAHTDGKTSSPQGLSAECSDWLPLPTKGDSNLAGDSTEQAAISDVPSTLKPLPASAAVCALAQVGDEREKIQRVSLFDDAHIIQHVLPVMQASTRALNSNVTMDRSRAMLQNTSSSQQSSLPAIHHDSFAQQPHGSRGSACCNSENLRDLQHHQLLMLPLCENQRSLTGSTHSMHERTAVTPLHQGSLGTREQHRETHLHHLMHYPSASVHAGSARHRTQHIDVSCATSNLLDVSVGKSAITSGSVLSMMIGGSIDGPALAGHTGPAQDQLAITWFRDHLQALGQDVGDKHVFVPFRNLPLPACGLLSSFLSYVPRVRAITLTHAGIDDAGALELAIGLKQSYGELWLLDLRRNRIGNKGALALAGCLPACPALQELILSHNSIGDEGVAGFTEALRNSNTAPQRVRVGDNPVSQEALKSLAAAYKSYRIRWCKREAQAPTPTHPTYPWHTAGNIQSLKDISIESNSPVQGIFDNVLMYEEDGHTEGVDQEDSSRHHRKSGMQPLHRDHMLCGSLPRGMIAMHASPSFGKLQPEIQHVSTTTTTKRLGPSMDANTTAALVKVLAATCLLEEHQAAQDLGVAVLSLTTRQACQNSNPARSFLALPTLSHDHSVEGDMLSSVHQQMYNETDSCKLRTFANSSPLPCSLSSFSNARTAAASLIDLDMLAAALVAKGHDAVVTATGGSGEVSACLQNLRHRYITVYALHPSHSTLQNVSLDGITSVWSQHDSLSNRLHSEAALAVGFSIDGAADFQTQGDISMHKRLHSRNPSQHGFYATNSIDVYSSPSPALTPSNHHITAQQTLPSLKGGIQHGMAVQNSFNPSSMTMRRVDSKQQLLQKLPGTFQSRQVDVSTHSAHGVVQKPCGAIEISRDAADLSRDSMCLSRASAVGVQVSSPRTVVDSSLMRIVVDPTFKEQFQIGNNTTERYQTILAGVPDIYVGHEDRLPMLVEILCEEMSLAFKDKGLSLPPWRKASSLMTKWKQKTSSSGSVCAPSSSHPRPGF